MKSREERKGEKKRRKKQKVTAHFPVQSREKSQKASMFLETEIKIINL